MTENTTRNLSLARGAIGKNEFKEAQRYYDEVRKEQPDNLEAEWFSLFAILVADDVTGATADQYVRLAEQFRPTLEYIAAMEECVDKQNLAMTMMLGFPPLRDIIHDLMIKTLARDRSAFPMEDIIKVDMAKPIIDKMTAVEEVLHLFGDGAPYCTWAVQIWSDKIAERYKKCPYRNFQDKGKELWFDDLAKRIKKYDPSYELPQFKQNGCIAFGDAAKAPAGR